MEPSLDWLSSYGRLHVEKNRVVVETSVEKLRDIAVKLSSQGFDHVASLTVVDLPKEGKFKLIYVVESYSKPDLLVEIVVEVPRSEPRVPSLVDVWPSLVLQERENWEMFGVVFEGHPDLRHLLLPPDWPDGVYPLRKDFVVKEEPITAPPELQKKAEELARQQQSSEGSSSGGSS